MADKKGLYDQANKLIREAKKLESKDTQKSINLVQEAIKIRSVYLQHDHFLLAKYQTMLGNYDKAHEIFKEMLKKLDVDNVYFYNTILSEIYEKECNLLFSQNKWKEFLLCYLSADYNKILGLCAQGKGMTMLDIILDTTSFDDYFLLNKSRLIESLKNINAENDKEFIFTTYISYLKDIIEDLYYLSEKGEECFHMNMEYDPKAAEIYYKLNSKGFTDYLNQKFMSYV